MEGLERLEELWGLKGLEDWEGLKGLEGLKGFVGLEWIEGLEGISKSCVLGLNKWPLFYLFLLLFPPPIDELSLDV